MVTNLVVHPGMPRTDHLMRKRGWRSYLESITNAGSDDDLSVLLEPDGENRETDDNYTLRRLETVEARVDGEMKHLGYVTMEGFQHFEALIGGQGTVRLHGGYVGRCVDYVAEQVAAVRQGVLTRKGCGMKKFMGLPDELELEEVVEGVDVEYGTVFLRYDDIGSRIPEGLDAENTTYVTGMENTVPHGYAVSDVRQTGRAFLEPIVELA